MEGSGYIIVKDQQQRIAEQAQPEASDEEQAENKTAKEEN